MTKANEMFRSREYAIALKYYSAVVELCPDESRGYLNRSAVYLKLGSFYMAYEDSRVALVRNLPIF